MSKSVRAPKGLYTASQAIQKLRMASATFHDHVKKGKIKKIIQPGRSEGFYEKAYIDRMAEANDLFAIQYASDPASFSTANIDDIEGIYRVMISFWGSLYVPSVELRQDWYQINPEIDYVVKQDGIVTGYITILPLKPEIMEKLMDGEIGTKDIKPDDVLPFTPKVPLECWVGIAVKTGVYKPEKYGIRLIAGAIQTIKKMGERGIYIKHLWAKSETDDGIKLCQELGFEEIDASPNKLPRKFVLDTDTTRSRHLQEYRRILKKALQKQ